MYRMIRTVLNKYRNIKTVSYTHLVDENSRKLSIGASNMIYESYTVVLSGEERISIAQLVDQDKLVIRGVGEKVYSVNVTAGHGYLKLTGVDALVGGYRCV